MPAERAGYTVTMFLVDLSPSMGNVRTIDLPPGPNGEQQTNETTNLEWSLQFVKLKIQEMIYNGRKTDQCGVIVFGSESTENLINERHGGYENVSVYIPIAQPSAATLAQIDKLRPSETVGDAIDALIVGIETQAEYLVNKKTWTRKVVLVTDGANPIEVEDWEASVNKMNDLDVSLAIIGVDFDDDELPYHEEGKSSVKRANETFYAQLTSSLKNGVVGTCALALREIARPDIKVTKSMLMGTVLRLGDIDMRPDEALEVLVKTSKCTSLSHAKGWKKFGRRIDPQNASKEHDSMETDEEQEKKHVYAQLTMRSEYYVDRNPPRDVGEDEDMQVDEDEVHKPKEGNAERIDTDQLVRGFKYGSTYVPCPDGQFPRLETKKSIDILGFFKAADFRHELAMGDVQYIWADPGNAQQQVALSSIVRAMKGDEAGKEKELYAIARWITKDGSDPKMGVLSPSIFENVDCLLWTQMPFADDVRKYTFASLVNLVSKKGEKVTKHPYIPTVEHMEAMDKFVDAMDLMEAGEKDEDDNRTAWFDPTLSYNPAVHRTKQAMFHCAVVSDISTNPLPPPHPELLKYMQPPRKVQKRAKEVTDACITAFKVKPVPKGAAKQRKDGHVPAQDDDDDMLLLDTMKPKPLQPGSQPISVPLQKRIVTQPSSVKHTINVDDNDTESDEDFDGPAVPVSPKLDGNPAERQTTPPRSLSPAVDPGRAPGRIIGMTYPLADFQKNISQGDVVSKAVEDFAWVIIEIIKKPFAMRRAEEILICLKTLRDTSLKEDEIDAWNAFLPELRKTCIESRMSEFWSKIVKSSQKLGLISKTEAKKYGGRSTITEAEATVFLSS